MEEQSAVFTAIVVGDELLNGKRVDKHLPHVIETLGNRGLQLSSCHIVGDSLQGLVMQLQQTRQLDIPVFCFGGIGATPDDNTRAAAAVAFQRPLQRHAAAAKLIEQQFAEGAYPQRILMADLPADAALIPNPYNNIPGFSVEQHHFLPGFPQMAWPMLDWVLDEYYSQLSGVMTCERSVRVYQVAESELIEMMELLATEHPAAKIFSLPHLGEVPTIEIGFRGPAVAVEKAYAALCHRLQKRGELFDRI
jgi:molybdopterin-biosynthesis enzyme MoeA-like protein